MQRVRKSVLVPFSAGEMHALVDDVATYPAFLPWCGGSEVLAQTEGGKTARVDINYHGVRAHFTTDNANVPPESIVVTLKDGPFRHLHGEWRFVPLAPSACRVELELHGPAELLVVAAQDILARAHHEAPDLGVRGSGPDQHAEDKPGERLLDQRSA